MPLSKPSFGGSRYSAAVAPLKVWNPFATPGAISDSMSLTAWHSMVDKSLVEQVPGTETRFTLLSTIREYALERLAASDDEPATRRAHAAYYLVLAEEGAHEVTANSQWLDLFELEHETFARRSTI